MPSRSRWARFRRLAATSATALACAVGFQAAVVAPAYAEAAVDVSILTNTTEVPALPDGSDIPTTNDLIDVTALKCPPDEFGFANAIHHHSMPVRDQVTGNIAYYWNVDIHVYKDCGHAAYIKQMDAYPSGVDEASGYRFDYTVENVIDPKGASGHATGQFSYFPVRVNDPCPPTTDGCPQDVDVSLKSHPTVFWTVNTRGDKPHATEQLS